MSGGKIMNNRYASTDDTNKLAVQSLVTNIEEFINQFHFLNESYQRGIYLPEKAEELLDKYTDFILNIENKRLWDREINCNDPKIKKIIHKAQMESAHCVWIVEKYRAQALIESGNPSTEYFNNIEGCIQDEFGRFYANGDSKVLLIGSGGFPMTPILIAKETGACVMGIDIDAEAIRLGNKVIEILGNDLKIQLRNTTYDKSEFVKKATHIIFASTIAEKFDILENLYDMTLPNAIAIMRYGNGFKSLFNYPLVENQKGKWEKLEQINNDNNIFDVAIYGKQNM